MRGRWRALLGAALLGALPCGAAAGAAEGAPAPSTESTTPAAPASPAPPAPAAPAGGDVVEIIDDGAPAAPPPLPAPPEDSVTFTGWARLRLSLGLVGTGAETGDELAVPFDRLVTQGQMHLRLRYARGRRFEAVLSGLLTGYLHEQDARPPEPFNLRNGEVRTGYEATLREAQVGLFLPRFDLRIGQQRIPWGRGDAFTPNDVVNAYDLRDQFLIEAEALRLPTFALRGDLSLGPLVLSAVLAPFFQPDRFDSYGGNWSLLQPGAPAAYRILAGRISRRGAVSPTLAPLLQPLLQQTALPPAGLDGTAAGLRAALSLGPADLDAYYHYGYDPTPYLQLTPELGAALALAAQAPDSQDSALLFLGGVAQGGLSATYARRHHVGLSAAAPAGPVLVRCDLAYDSQAVLAGADLQGVLRPVIQGVAGLEYQRGEVGKALALEAHYLYVVDSPGDGALLLQRTHSVSLAALGRWSFLRDHLQVELRALLGLAPLSYVLRPQLAILVRGLELRLGALVPGGEEGSFGSYFRRNLQLYSMLRYGF